MFSIVLPDSSQPCRCHASAACAPSASVPYSRIFSEGFFHAYSLRHCFSFIVHNNTNRIGFAASTLRLQKIKQIVKGLFTFPTEIAGGNPFSALCLRRCFSREHTGGRHSPSKYPAYPRPHSPSVNKPKSHTRLPSRPRSLPTVPTDSRPRYMPSSHYRHPHKSHPSPY